MAFRKVLGALAVMCLVAGCAKNPDGTTANIFSDLRAVSGSDDVSPQQEALREQAEEYRDYAKARLQGAAAGAVLGGLIGALADRNAGRGALVGALAGGTAGYIGATYLTRDHSQFVASQKTLDEDTKVANELTASSQKNVRVAQSALNYQRTEIARLNEAYRTGKLNAQGYESKLKDIARDQESVKSMIATTEERVTKMESSIATYRGSGFDTGYLELANSAQKRDIDNLRKIEDAMVLLISSAPAGVSRPSV